MSEHAARGRHRRGARRPQHRAPGRAARDRARRPSRCSPPRCRSRAIFSASTSLTTARRRHPRRCSWPTWSACCRSPSLYVVQRCFYALGGHPHAVPVHPRAARRGRARHPALRAPPRSAGSRPASRRVISIGGTVQLVVAVVLLRRRIGPLAGPPPRRRPPRLASPACRRSSPGSRVLALLGGFGDGWPSRRASAASLGAAARRRRLRLVYVAVLAALRAPGDRLATTSSALLGSPRLTVPSSGVPEAGRRPE